MGTYGVGVGPLVQKHPAGKLTVGKHSKPEIQIIKTLYCQLANNLKSNKLI